MSNPPGTPASRRAARQRAEKAEADAEARLAREEAAAARELTQSVQERLAGQQRARIRRFGRRTPLTALAASPASTMTAPDPQRQALDLIGRRILPRMMRR